MATFVFDDQLNGQVIAFNVGADVLFFNDPTPASFIVLSQSLDGADVIVTVVEGPLAGKSVVLASVFGVASLAPGNFDFLSGEVRIGDLMIFNIQDNVGTVITGTAGGDYIAGLGGNDTLIGGDGDDRFHLLRGGAANSGFDSVAGGNGFDVIAFDASDDLSVIPVGVDLLEGSAVGGYSLSQVTFSGIEGVSGTRFNDTIFGNDLANLLDGARGNDSLFGDPGDDTLIGGNGSDTLDGGSGIDRIFGGGGNDTFYFSGFSDHIDGGTGRDTISFQKLTSGITLDNNSWNEVSGSVTAVEKIIGSQYADWIEQGGATFQIIIDGGSGNDHLTGDQNTRLNGGGGNDTIDMGLNVTDVGGKVLAFGDSGNDTLFAQEMTGGSGGDTFILDYTYATHFGPANANAIIHDFQSGIDHIIFRGPVPIESGGLTHIGDLWTIHSPDPDYQNGNENITFDVSYTIEGITTLQASDYSFDVV